MLTRILPHDLISSTVKAQRSHMDRFWIEFCEDIDQSEGDIVVEE